MSAPKQEPLFGKRDIAIIGIKYRNLNRHVGSGTCKTVANAITTFYERASRDKLQIDPKGLDFSTELAGVKKNVNKAEAQVLHKFPGYDNYGIIGTFKGPNSGHTVSHLPGALIATAIHEFGHQFNLGHAGYYKKGKGGKIYLDHYGDNGSIMSNKPSNFLTSPQYYHLKWTPDSEVVVLKDKDIIAAPRTFTIKQLNRFPQEALSTIIIVPEGGGRSYYLSYTPMEEYSIVLHLSDGGSSQKVRQSKESFYEANFTGLDIVFINVDKALNLITFSVQKKPINKEMNLADFELVGEHDAIINLDDDDTCCLEDGPGIVMIGDIHATEDLTP